MIPAFANVFVFSMAVTRATMVPSPVICSELNWNASAVPQMSAPAPLTVHVDPLSVELPLRPTAPTSCDVNPEMVIDTLSKVDVFNCVVS